MYIYISIYIYALRKTFYVCMYMTLFPHLFLQPGRFFLLVVSTDQSLRMVLSSWRKILKPRRSSMTLAVPSCWVQLRCRKKGNFCIEPVSCCWLGIGKTGPNVWPWEFFCGHFLNWGKKVCFEVKSSWMCHKKLEPTYF